MLVREAKGRSPGRLISLCLMQSKNHLFNFLTFFSLHASQNDRSPPLHIPTTTTSSHKHSRTTRIRNTVAIRHLLALSSIEDNEATAFHAQTHISHGKQREARVCTSSGKGARPRIQRGLCCCACGTSWRPVRRLSSHRNSAINPNFTSGQGARDTDSNRSTSNGWDQDTGQPGTAAVAHQRRITKDLWTARQPLLTARRCICSRPSRSRTKYRE